MLKTLKFSGNETDYFFVSDLHINHNRDFIYTKRINMAGEIYKNVEEHDQGIVHKWNSVCNKNSIIFNCGDVIFNDPDGSKFINLMRKLNFKEHYILWGNHTSGHRQIYIKQLANQFPDALEDGELKYEIYPLRFNIDNNPYKTVTFLPQYAEIKVNSTEIVLSHYPIISHNHMSHKTLHICGHSHGGCEITNKNTGKGFRLDVGIESFSGPISLKEVKYHLKDRDVNAPDHH